MMEWWENCNSFCFNEKVGLYVVYEWNMLILCKKVVLIIENF